MCYLGPKRPQGPPKVHSWITPGPPKLEPKSTKNRSGTHSKFNNFFDWLLDRFFEQLGANLGPTWPSKWHQVGAKLSSTWLPRWHPRATCQNMKNIKKTNDFSMKFEGRGSKIEAKLAQKSSKNRSTKQSKTRPNLDSILEGSWGQLGFKMAPSWGQVGAKLAPKSPKIEDREDIEKSSYNKAGR